MEGPQERLDLDNKEFTNPSLEFAGSWSKYGAPSLSHRLFYEEETASSPDCNHSEANLVENPPSTTDNKNIPSVIWRKYSVSLEQKKNCQMTDKEKVYGNQM